MKQKTKFKETEIGKIPEDWGIGKFKEDLIVKGRIGWKGYKTTDLRDKGPIVLGGENIKSFYYMNFFKVKHLSKEKYDESPEIQLKPNDVLLVTRGNLGEVAHFKGEFKEVTINPSIVILSEFSGNSAFLYYFLISQQGKNSLSYIKSGSSVPAIYQSEVKKIIYPKPPLPEQKQIANILSSLDNKIELNNKMCENLMGIGQRLFRKWFVNLEEVPDKWETKALDEIADFLNGLALQKYPAKEGEDYLPVIKIRELRNGITEQTSKASFELPEEYIIKDGDVLFSWSGSLEVEIWTQGQGALNQHLFKVTSEKYPKWFYYFWTKQYLPEFRHIAAGKATTMGHIQRHNLSESEVLIPDEKSLKEMNKTMEPILEQYISLKLENNKLSKIRDLILPKLMNGEIRVPVAN